MSRQRVLLIAGILTVVAVAAATAVLLVGEPAGSEPPEAPAGTPTVPPEIIANTVEDALRLSSGLFTGYGSTLSLAKPQSVSYVETTVGRARAMFDPDRPGGWELPDDAPAWAIVAYGQFKGGSGVITDPPPQTISTVWIVFLQGREVMRSGGSNQRYDLSRLGTVVELPEPVWREYCVPGDKVNPNKCSPNP